LLAVVNAWIANAVNPFAVLAKQHLSPEATPISSEMWFRPRAAESSANDGAEHGRGPEMGILGLDQFVEIVGLGDSSLEFRRGGPPMMPPSKKLIVGDFWAKRSPIVRALRGEMAFKSK
jgi:hypothetical protein